MLVLVSCPKNQVKEAWWPSWPAMFIGYDQKQKAYKLLNFSSDKVIVLRDVLFDELGHNCKRSPEDQCVHEEMQSDEEQSLLECRDSSESLEKGHGTIPPGPSPATDTNLSSDQATQATARSSGKSLPRRSTRQRKHPGEWWKAPTALLTAASDINLSHNKNMLLSLNSILYTKKRYVIWSPGRKPETCWEKVYIM